MYKNLDHLSDDEVKTLIKRYYEGEAVAKLVKEYHLAIHASELYKLFPPKICADEFCKYCGENLVRDRLSKTAITYGFKNSDMYCPICHHRPYDLKCRCENCIEEERRLMNYRINQIKKMYSREREPVDFYGLSFEQKVFLGALCRSLGKENLFEIKPYMESNVVLAPTSTL